MKQFLPKRVMPEDERLVALAVSAFVCPGAGQCMAGRWLLGIAFAMSFTATVLAWSILLLWPFLWRLLRPLNEWISGESFPVPAYEWRWILISFLGTCVIYCSNLLDAWLQVRRTMKT